MDEGVTNYSKLKRSEKRSIEEPLGMQTGYVLDFSNRTIEEFFEDEFDLEFYSRCFDGNGPSKANHLRSILESVPPARAAHILRRLWDYRTTLPSTYRCETPDLEDSAQEQFFLSVSKLEGEADIARTDGFEHFEKSDTLHELLSAMERDIIADKPQAALDRLHTYCQMKFRSLLTQAGVPFEKDEPLNSKVGKYVRFLETAGGISPMSLAIIKSSISVFERFNTVRNDQSLAHDNTLIQAREARFIFDSVSSILRFLKGRDPVTFGD